MPTLSGIFILGEFVGPVADRIHEISMRHDPKMAKARRPHVTLVGSSGLGPIDPKTPVPELRRKLQPITDTASPIELYFQAPHRFLQTDIVVLPFDPHGPIRHLHDRISNAGLFFQKARFNFSPHVTLTLYKTLTREALAELMQVKIDEPVILDKLQIYLTNHPSPARLLLELELKG